MKKIINKINLHESLKDKEIQSFSNWLDYKAYFYGVSILTIVGKDNVNISHSDPLFKKGLRIADKVYKSYRKNFNSLWFKECKEHFGIEFDRGY